MIIIIIITWGGWAGCLKTKKNLYYPKEQPHCLTHSLQEKNTQNTQTFHNLGKKLETRVVGKKRRGHTPCGLDSVRKWRQGSDPLVFRGLQEEAYDKICPQPPQSSYHRRMFIVAAEPSGVPRDGEESEKISTPLGIFFVMQHGCNVMPHGAILDNNSHVSPSKGIKG